MQAIGRGVNRSAADPLDIHLLTDVCLPITVEELRSWGDVRPGMRNLQLARGVAVASASHAAQLYSDLWPSASAAREVARQERCVRHALEESPKADLTHLFAGTYRRKGQGARAGSFEDALGTLASCDYNVNGVLTVYEAGRRPTWSPTDAADVPSPSGEAVNSGTGVGVPMEKASE